MSLYELLPTLTSFKDLLEDLHGRLSAYQEHAQEDASQPHHSIPYRGKLASLAAEVSNQIRTAKRPFTVAVVGEFKVGKSTLLNALLGLSGASALSAADTPDTACSIVIRHRGESDPESRLHFIDRPEAEDVAWERAKQITSQAWLETHPQDQALARRLLEVEYFLKVPVLDQINLNDLPGTGSRYWREHTQRTHQRMKEADAVIWVIGDEEPSRDAQRDLEILKECSQSVIPVLNVREDPTMEPPLIRDRNIEDEIARIVVREFRQFFAPSLDAPVRVSAKVVELERAKAAPDASVLQDAGFDDLGRVFAEMIIAPASGQGQGRLCRLVGATRALALDAESLLDGEILPALSTSERKARGQVSAREEKLAELEDLEIDLRSRIKSLARERAEEVVRIVGAHARTFVGDELQLTNFRAMKHVFTEKGRARLERDLRDRFLSKYLQLDQPANWLTKLSKEYADNVRGVLLPAWRRFARSMTQQVQIGEISSIEQPDFDRLSDALLQGIMAVFIRLAGIGGAAALLAAIPGGAIIDAVGVVGLLILGAISDPLAGARRRAMDRIGWQVEVQKYAISDSLKAAAEEGSARARADMRRFVQGEASSAAEALAQISETRRVVRSGMERLAGLLEGLRAFSEGR